MKQVFRCWQHFLVFFFEAGVSKTVFGLFTDIIGFEVNDIYFNSNDTTIYQLPLSRDVSTLFKYILRSKKCLACYKCTKFIHCVNF